MIKDAKPIPLKRVFSTDTRYLYNIPLYQRAYTWGLNEWNTLFNDILYNDNGYFLGSIICVNSAKSTMQNDVEFQLIDGQQRLTSLSILLLAIYNKLSAFKSNFSENQLDRLKDIKKEIVMLADPDSDEDIYIPRLRLQVQGNNQEDYLGLLTKYKILSNYDIPKNIGNRRILKAFNAFTKNIESYLEEDDVDKVKKIFGLLDKINSSVLVFIEVDSNKDAYMLFESLNNRGIPLSAIDLIKNHLISEADDKKNPKIAEQAFRQWERIIRLLGEEYGDQERFLRQYYNSFREELNMDYRSEDDKNMYPLGYLATKSSILEIYEKMINNNYQSFLNELESKAKIYSILINNASDENEIPELKNSLINLERIQGAPSYLLLLYVISNKDSLSLTYADINEIVEYLVKFFVRRNLTDFPNTRNLNKIFMDTVSLIRDKNENVVELIIGKLKYESSSDKDFKSKLEDDVYINNYDATRFLLCYYEEKYSTKEIHTDLWEKDKHNKSVWTIEHIFPEGENIPQEWIDMIADGDKDKADLYREKYVHKLGNLTITGYNQNLSNMSFDKKKHRTKDGKDIGYLNKLKLNEDVAICSEWKVKNITDRTKKLVDVFVEEFKL